MNKAQAEPKSILTFLLSLGGLLLLANILSNIPTISIFGVPITLIASNLGLHIKFFTLWLIYILIVTGSIYAFYKLITKASQVISEGRKLLKKVFHE